MRHTTTPILTVLVALSTVGSGQIVAQSSSPSVARLSLAGPAKRFCSGIWVSERNRQEALYNSVLLGARLVEEYERGDLEFDIDEERRVVTASRDGVSAGARHFGDQGCVILRPETDKPVFTPRRVVSSLPDAASTPWPMGDRLPDTPLRSDVDGTLLDQAARTSTAPSSTRPLAPSSQTIWTAALPSSSSIEVGSWWRSTAQAPTRTCSSRAGRWERA